MGSDCPMYRVLSEPGRRSQSTFTADRLRRPTAVEHKTKEVVAMLTHCPPDAMRPGHMAGHPSYVREGGDTVVRLP